MSLVLPCRSCRDNYYCYHSLDAAVKTALRSGLPADAYKKCQGTGYAAYTLAQQGKVSKPVLTTDVAY